MTEEYQEEEENESYFVYTAEVEDDSMPTAMLPRPLDAYLASASTSAGYMIVDTACQKLCHGKEWRHGALSTRSCWQSTSCSALQDQLKSVSASAQGGPRKIKSLIPSVIAGQPMVLHSSELQTGIPLLGSLSLMTYLGTVIDLAKGEACFTKIKLTAPLAKLSNGHVAISILQVQQLDETFPATFHQWPLATDELALPPNHALSKKEHRPLYYQLDEGEERDEHQTHAIEREYEFDTQRFGSNL